MIPSFPVRRTENRRGACGARATVVPRGLQDVTLLESSRQYLIKRE